MRKRLRRRMVVEGEEEDGGGRGGKQRGKGEVSGGGWMDGIRKMSSSEQRVRLPRRDEEIWA